MTRCGRLAGMCDEEALLLGGLLPLPLPLPLPLVLVLLTLPFSPALERVS